MKKTLALILSVLLTFSCFAVCMASPVAAAESENLLADYDVYDWTFAGDRHIDAGDGHEGRITHNPGESYKGGYSFGARSVGSRGFYLTFPVEANKEYTLSFAVKSMYTYEYVILGDHSELTYNDPASTNKIADQTKGTKIIDKAILNAKLYTGSGSFKEEGEWVEVNYTFTPTKSADYDLAFSFGPKGTDADGNAASTDLSINPYYFAISDLSLTTPVADAEEETNVVNLLEGITVKDWLSDPADNRVLNNAKETNVSRYGGYAFISTSVHYQGMRLPFSVKANTEYELSFSVKSSADWENIAVFDATGIAFTAGGGKNYTIGNKADTTALAALKANTYSSTVDGVADLSGVDAAQWTDVTFNFTPTADSDNYVLYLAWGGSLGYNNVIISDLKLTAIGAVPTSVEGNGTVTTDPEVATFGEPVTYTATAYAGESFIGWYNGETLLSTDATITGFAGVDVPTAKFTSKNLLGGKTVKDWLSDPADNRVLTSAKETNVSRYGGYAFISTSVHYQGMRLPFSVKANTEYELSFSVKSSADWENIAVFDATGIAFTAGGGKNYTIGNKADTTALAALKANTYSSTVDGVADLSGVDAAQWTDVTFNFTPTADSDNYVLYLAWGGSLGYNNVIISDLKLLANRFVTVTANAEGNGAVKADPAVVEYGQPATLIATPYQNDRFIGWFDSNNTLISIEKTYSVSAVYGAVDVTAKFTGNNILADMTADDWYDINNTGYEGVSIVVDDATAESRYGGTAVKLAKDSAYRGTHIDIPAVTGGTYKIQVEVYRPEGASITNLTLAGAASYNPSSGQQANIYVWNQLTDSNGKKISETTTSGWLTYTGIFELTAGTDYDIYVECAGGCNGAIFSDISLVEYAAEADSLHTAHNNSLAIRGANEAEGVRSGSRIYNTISKDWIENKNIVEFGVLAIRTERLNGGDLTLSTPGIAYSTAWTSGGADNKLWNETEDKYEFTAVLINIAYKYFDDSYTMTTYAKDSNGNIYYGDDQELSMYQAIYAILESENASEADKAVATELADSGSEKGDTTYDAWKAAWNLN